MFLYQFFCILLKKENVNHYRTHPVITKTPLYIIKEFIAVPLQAFSAGMVVLSRDLSLRFGNFFNKDPGH